MGKKLTRTLTQAICLYVSMLAEFGSPCVISESSCPCAKTTPSGTCVRSQGNGTCLLDNCVEGFRCDCLAFEICSITSCAKYEASFKEMESRTTPFRCAPNPNAGKCVSFTDVLDTTEASAVAVEQAAIFVDEASDAALASSTDLALLYTERRQIAIILAKIDVVAHLVTTSARAAIDEAAISIDRFVSAAHGELIAIHTAAANALVAYLAVSRDKGDATRYMNLAEKTEMQRLSEKVMAEKENQTCGSCETLAIQVEQFKQLSQSSARNASLAAIMVRDFKDLARIHANQMKLRVEEAAQARAKGLLEGEKVLEEVRTRTNIR